MASRMPWFKFHAADWLSDPSLRLCSLAARGAWIDLLAVMHGSNANRGYLRLPNGTPMQAVHVGRVVGCTTDQAAEILHELEEAGVFSRSDDGCIYSRRMVRDEADYQTFSAHGAKGGNPRIGKGSGGGLTPPLTPPVNPPLKPPLNPDSDSDSDSDSDADKDKDTGNAKAAAIAARGSGKAKTKFTIDDAKAHPTPMGWPPDTRAAWEAWIESRYAGGKPPTRRALDMALAKLGEWPPPKVLAALRDAAVGGWQGIYEPTNGKGTDVRGNRRNEVVGASDERIDIPIYRANA